jgi:DNA polymerase III alpha subunit
MMKHDVYGQAYVDSDLLCDMLYRDPNLSIENFLVADPDQFNASVDQLYSGDRKLSRYVPLDIPVEEFDRQNQAEWYMPESYKNFDIAEYVLSLCASDTEIERVGRELVLYEDRGLFDLLRYLRYLVDTMREHNIVWGVGRGSSTASYVLFLLGVHKIDSILYDLPIEEFLK